MFELLETSSKMDADSDCVALYVADVTDYPPVTASSLEVSISEALATQQSRGCNLANTSRLMGCDYQTWKLHGMENEY